MPYFYAAKLLFFFDMYKKKRTFAAKLTLQHVFYEKLTYHLDGVSPNDSLPFREWNAA
jgi:hypothetical protein